MQRIATKYFATHAHPDVRLWARSIPDEFFDECVVIPARRESECISNIIQSLKVAGGGRKILVIIVVNASIDSDDQILSDNLSLILNLAGRSAIQDPTSFVQNENLRIFILNRSISPFLLPLKSGVGLARKMGSDLAAYLCSQKKIKSPWIYSTDADAVVPSDYFEPLSNSAAQTAVFPFTHEPASIDPHSKLATKVYDLFLHYYPAGLRFAQSPYAFQTIGSCLAFRWETYLKVRGFPVREAAEDFYFLNKAVKTGEIVEASSRPIKLSGRLSDRVPFGTGQSIRKNILFLKSGTEIQFYDPEVFWVLRTLIASFKVFAQTRKVSEWRENLLQDERRGLWILRICEELNATENFAELAKRNPRQESLLKAIHTWFDGLRTLKFIHRVRDLYLPSVPWFEAIKAAPFETTSLSDRRPSSKSIREEGDNTI